MKYASIAEGRAASGLRLVLTAEVPGPWGEAAKYILAYKGLAYLPVAQLGGGANEELQAWTGQAGAPVAVWNDEPPRSESIDILYLAERLAPEPRLIPEDVTERVRMFGLIREVIGRRGIGWERRIMMIEPLASRPDAPPNILRLAERYGCRPGLAASAPFRVAAILRELAATLHAQSARGVPYFIGDAPTALDFYWASFANMLQPLPHEVCPMPAYMRVPYTDIGPVIAEALDPVLVTHRDMMFREHIGLPLDFLSSPDG
jgi:glutathione S-transferase